MDKTVNTVNDLGKCTELSKTNDLYLTVGSYRILILKYLPGIILSLFFFFLIFTLLTIKRFDIYLNLIADINDF